MHNPYHAPGADLSAAPDIAATYDPLLWSADGRIGRLRYVAYSFGLSVALLLMCAVLFFLLIGVPSGMGLLRRISGIVMLGVGLVMSKRRLHDMDQSGWWAVLSLLPLVNLLFGLWLLCAPGTRGENRFGPEPAPNSPLVVLGAAAAGVAALVLAGSVALMAYKMSQAGLSGVAPAAERR